MATTYSQASSSIDSQERRHADDNKFSVFVDLRIVNFISEMCPTITSTASVAVPVKSRGSALFPRSRFSNDDLQPRVPLLSQLGPLLLLRRRLHFRHHGFSHSPHLA